MELIQYLNDSFYSKQQLLALTKTDDADFRRFQEQKIMPKCSYKLALTMNCDSFLGAHKNHEVIEYYAKGYVSWLELIKSKQNALEIYQYFEQSYLNNLAELKKVGFSSSNSKVTGEVKSHIKEEWQHFLNGTYGLCTRSGLPHDIAAKELAIIIINELCDVQINNNNDLTNENRAKLNDAVNLLDKASAEFAPHERLNSSRERLINVVREKYNLCEKN